MRRMKNDAALLEFIEAAKSQGASDDSLVGVLKGQGWPTNAIYEALAAHYQKLTGLKVPTRRRSGAAAKDAFYYLLSFSTLATWTIGLGSLTFTLIEKWIADPLAQNGFSTHNNYALASSLASIVVAFPIYLCVMRLIIRDVRSDSEKLESPVRKWLTYIALLIAAAVMIGDLVTVLEYFLRGEFTSRFIAKAATVIVISGAVFWYYLGELKTAALDREMRWSRNARAAAATSSTVALAIVLGFLSLGRPSVQRLVQADNKRVANLGELANQIKSKWMSSNHVLPSNIDGVPSASFLKDPVTHAPYEYRAKGANKYELCATFSTDTRQDTPQGEDAFWNHPKGHFCFALDASEATPQGFYQYQY
jgi:uncharacterized protein DUF5671